MKKILLGLILIFASGALHAGAWPTDNVTTTNLDAATDDPSQARSEIYNALLRLKDVIGARSSASGVCPLDASALVPIANIPDLSGKNITGGTINNVPIGATTPNSGAFTTISSTGAVTSTKSCASGYTRITPNYCRRTTWLGWASLTISTCTTVAAPDSVAKMVDLYIESTVASANSVALRYITTNSFTTNSCSTTEDATLYQLYEFNAITAGTTIGVLYHNMIAHVHSGNYYLKNGGTTSSSSRHQPVGYWD